MRLLLTLTLSLTLVTVAAADDPKPVKPPEPKTVAEAKKQLADAADIVEKKAAERAKARAGLDVTAAKYEKVRAVEFAKAEEVDAAERKAMAGFMAKTGETKAVLDKARDEESDAQLVLSVADARLKAAVNPKDVADGKKKVVDLKAVLDAKTADADKAAEADKASLKAYKEAGDASQRRIRNATDAAFFTVKAEEIKVVEARKALNEAKDQLDAASVRLHRAKESLLYLEEQEKK